MNVEEWVTFQYPPPKLEQKLGGDAISHESQNG